jgi:Capsule assembly protein Wzi/PAP2 superfamily
MIRLLIVALLTCSCFAQTQSPSAPETKPGTRTDAKNLFRNVVNDQKPIWTAPAHLKWRDATWLVPIAGVTGVLIATDHDVAQTIARHPRFESQASTLSNAGLAAFGAATAGFYLWGRSSNDPHRRETGLLSAEAIADTLAVTEVVKYATRRERPFENTQGRFYRDDASFPSGHAALSFAAASVIAHEYPGAGTQLLAYGTAAGVAVSRMIAQKHFTSDVFIGGTLGYLIGRSVYRARHDHELPGAAWGTFEPDPDQQTVPTGASAFVPIDSWVYPAFDRLFAAGYVQSNLLGLRPWTRRECARLTEEAQEYLETDQPGSEAAIVRDLAGEFAAELAADAHPQASIDSIYFRSTSIVGQPVSDSFHFGQTITNDYGRPYGEGWNGIIGVTASASAGPVVIYLRGEGERSAATPGISPATARAIDASDFLPLGTYSTSGTPSALRLRPLEAYIAYGFHDWQLTAGTQSLWLGPSVGGPMLFSNNAAPMPMLRISRTSPAELPSLLRWMGPVRTEFFIGRLTGQRFIGSLTGFLGPNLPKQPFIAGQKLSFKPTANLEIGVSMTALLGGPGQPLTAKNLARGLFTGASISPVSASDPSDRRSGIDFTYRIPHLRDRVIFYTDAFADDWISPLANPRRAAMQPGIYLPKVPAVNKLDLRLEAAYTDVPSVRDVGFFYFNARFNSGYTNAGNLIGNAVGREGRSITASSTYWFAPRRSLQFGFRNFITDREFLGGGSIQDASSRADVALTPQLSLQAVLQYERWSFPLLAPRPKTDVVASVQLTFRPRNWKTR